MRLPSLTPSGRNQEQLVGLEEEGAKRLEELYRQQRIEFNEMMGAH